MSPRHVMEPGASSPHRDRTPGWSLTRRSSNAEPRPGAMALLRPLARRVHFLAGLLVAPFLLMLCLTGLVYVFSPQIHNDLYAAQFYVDEVGGTPLPIAEQVAAAMAAHPEAELQSVVPPPVPDRTTRVNLSVASSAAPDTARTVFVDPYTNYIRGEMVTVDGRTPANIWLRELHSSMHLGEIGRQYSEIASSWLPVILVGGLVAWIAKQGRRRRAARELLVPVPRRGSGIQTRLRAVHGPLGIWLTLGLLVMSITGLTMSRFAGWGLPEARVPTLALAAVDVRRGADMIGVDRVVQVARTAGLQGELEVRVPATPSQPFAVAETSPGLPMHKTSIAVNPYTEEITARIGWGDYPALAQLRELGVQLHTGTLFGLANQILLALFVVAVIVLILLGYRMWWKRSPNQAPPARALRGLPARVGVPLLLVTVGLGWLMPAFGISLVAFLVIDLAVRAVREQQERARKVVVAGGLLAAAALFGAAGLIGKHPPADHHTIIALRPDRTTPDAIAAPGDPEAPESVTGRLPWGERMAQSSASRAGTDRLVDVSEPVVRPGEPAGSAGTGSVLAPATRESGDGTPTPDGPAGVAPSGADITGGGSAAAGPVDGNGSAGVEHPAVASAATGAPTRKPVVDPNPQRAPTVDPATGSSGVVAGLFGRLSTLVTTVTNAVGGLLGG
ncbi:PepSY domain-containing protein [Pseudonocardia sp. GCM10023141]|uniref:PepSY domain-containing protein n=1 Tax=Pseudonocardia sp. GCM10023141 TaxID=3252653 RepID=UPI0036112B03